MRIEKIVGLLSITTLIAGCEAPEQPMQTSSTSAVTVFQSTQTGAELLTNPNVSFPTAQPVQVGSSIRFSQPPNLGILINWNLLPAGMRGDLSIKIAVDYTPLNTDNDISFGIGDSIGFQGILRADNHSGSFWWLDTTHTTTAFPHLIDLISETVGIGAVLPFEFELRLPNGGAGPSELVNVIEGGFSLPGPIALPNNPVNSDNALSFLVGGDSNSMSPLILHSVTVTIEDTSGQGCPASSEVGGGSYCSEECPCEEGEGDCDGTTEECASGLTCVHNVGANYGWDPEVDVCEATCHGSAPGTGSYCSEECPCEEGEGDCDGTTEQCAPGLTCVHNVGANYGWDPEVDVCEATCHGSAPGTGSYCSEECPCEEGEGDCDGTTEQCAPGLTCVHNVGANYGWDPDVDVCESICPSSMTDWSLLDQDVGINNIQAFLAFTQINGYPRYWSGGEILNISGPYRLGVTNRAGPTQLIIEQYIRFKYPSLQFCEFFVFFEDEHCPTSGGVLFIQPATPPTVNVAGWVRSEWDNNCTFSPACPNILPGACYGNEFGNHTVKEIWIR